MKLLRTPARLLLLLILSAVVLGVCALGMEMNRQGLAAAFAKRPIAEGQLLQPISWTFHSGAGLADGLATGITMMLFSGVWFAFYEAFKLRRLARDRESYVRAGDTEKAALAREVMRDMGFWLAVLAGPTALLAGINFYLLSRYADVERLWLSLGIALCGPLMFGYLSDRIVGTWQTLRGLIAERKAFATSARHEANWSPSEAVPPSNATRSTRIDGESQAHLAAPAVPVRFDLSENEQRVRAGGNAEFRWSITGARAAALRAGARGKQFAVPLQGALLLAAPLEEEQFDLIATGLDGAQHERTLRVIPAVVSVDDPVDELKALDAPWN